jgi:hypothetical protein
MYARLLFVVVGIFVHRFGTFSAPFGTCSGTRRLGTAGGGGYTLAHERSDPHRSRKRHASHEFAGAFGGRPDL